MIINSTHLLDPRTEPPLTDQSLCLLKHGQYVYWQVIDTSLNLFNVDDEDIEVLGFVNLTYANEINL